MPDGPLARSGGSSIASRIFKNKCDQSTLLHIQLGLMHTSWRIMKSSRCSIWEPSNSFWSRGHWLLSPHWKEQCISDCVLITENSTQSPRRIAMTFFESTSASTLWEREKVLNIGRQQRLLPSGDSQRGKNETAFVSHHGLFQFIRMLFEEKNTSSTFQPAIDAMFPQSTGSSP